MEEPTLCPNDICRARFSFRLEHNRSLFTNKQIIKMQARPLHAFQACICIADSNRTFSWQFSRVWELESRPPSCQQLGSLAEAP